MDGYLHISDLIRSQAAHRIPLSLSLSVYTCEHLSESRLMYAEEVGVSSPAALMLGGNNFHPTQSALYSHCSPVSASLSAS